MTPPASSSVTPSSGPTAARPPRIVVATDGSPASAHALAWTREIAALDGDSRVWAVHVTSRPHAPSAFGVDGPALLALADRALAGIRVDTLLAFGEPEREVPALADAVKASLVVLGRSTCATANPPRASVSAAVIGHARASVLLARTLPRPATILVARDASRAGDLAAKEASKLARAWKAELQTLSTHARTSAAEVARHVSDVGATLLVTTASARGAQVAAAVPVSVLLVRVAG